MENEEKIAQCRNAILVFVINNIENKLPIKEEEMREILDKDKALFKGCLPSVIQALKKVIKCSIQMF